MLSQLELHWSTIRDRMILTHHGVDQGKMMSADALTYRGKVFAFFSTKGGRTGLGCRVGRTANLSSFSLNDWQHLAPFKTKPPMKDWIVLGEGDLLKWDKIANLCLELAQTKGN